MQRHCLRSNLIPGKSLIGMPVLLSPWILSLLFLIALTSVGCGNRSSADHTERGENPSNGQALPSPTAEISDPTRVSASAVTKATAVTADASHEVAAAEPVVEQDVAAESAVVEPAAVSTAVDDGANAEGLPLSRTVNVLVLGSDRRPNMPNWRTDVMMILAMDLKTGKAGVISIPRDVYVDVIPNHQPNRINVIDYLGERDEPDGGGPLLLAGILQEKLGITIDHYLRFDFEGFTQVIDALGGLEITLDCAVSDYLPEQDIYLSLAPGTHRLTGVQALAYVRSRRQGGDLDRARRQQRVIWAVRDQILRENLISRVPALYAALHDRVQTDINLVSAIRYVRFAMRLDAEDVHGIVLAPPDMLRPGWRLGMSVFIADWGLVAEKIQTIFDGPALLDAEANAKDGQKFYCQ